MRPSHALAALVAGLGLAAGPGLRAAAEVAPAAGGRRLLEAAAAAESTVAGVLVSAPEALDRHGRRARLRVERVLHGPLEPGAEIAIAWEELARGRPPRFAEGDRVLLALDPRPGSTIWRRRLPEGEARVVAAEGRGFLRAPREASVEALGAYLALAPEARAGAAGCAALARLVAAAEEPLARAALERLAASAEAAGAALAEEARAPLAALLADPERPRALRRALLERVGPERFAALGPEVRALAEGSGPPELRAAALDAGARLEGGLDPERARALLRSEEAPLRAAGVRHVPADAVATESLASLARDDPAPEVRAAALERLLGADPPRIEAGVAALDDPSGAVRGVAVRGLGALGGAAVPALVEAAREGGEEVLPSALGALALAGDEGRAALRRLARAHPDEEARALARTLLGREARPGHGGGAERPARPEEASP